MKQMMITAICSMAAIVTMAQDKNDTGKVDTIKAGNFIIIKKNKDKEVADSNQHKTYRNLRIHFGDGGPQGIKITNDSIQEKPHIGVNVHFNNQDDILKKRKRKQSNISTNWWIFDLGFANFRDNTNYTIAQSLGYLKTLNLTSGPVTKNSMALNTGKSSNANIWFFMQKLNITQHVLNLKYGLGLEMYNYRYDKSLSYRSSPNAFIFNDSIGFSKNKIYAGYLTVPLMINVNATPHKRNGFSFSGGISAGYLLGAHDKQISAQRGKQKYHGDFDLQPWRVALIGELGLGPVRLFGSYSLNAFHNESTGLQQYPYAVGIRFSNW
jgi:hypothetical protein